jgi:hypothetical protein
MYLRGLIAILVSLLAARLEMRFSGRERVVSLRPSDLSKVDLQSLDQDLVLEEDVDDEVTGDMKTDLVFDALYAVLEQVIEHGLVRREIQFIIVTSIPWRTLGIEDTSNPAAAAKAALLTNTATLAVEWSYVIISLLNALPEAKQQSCHTLLFDTSRTALITASRMVAYGQSMASGFGDEWEADCNMAYLQCADKSSIKLPAEIERAFTV